MRYLRFMVAVTVIALAMAFIAGAAEPDQAAGKTGDFRKQHAWEIKNAKITNNGTSTKMPQGTLIDSITIEADAVSGEGDTIQGKFALTCSLFSPQKSLPGQQKGHWYVRGNWTIKDPSAPPEQLKYRHTPAVVKGAITADLTFNPLKTPGKINGSVRLVSGKKGAFSGNEKFEGSLRIIQ